MLSERLKDLQQMRVSKQTTLAKFKDIAGSNWKTSSLCNVISTISTHIYDLDACVKRTLNTVDGIIQVCAEMNACLEFCCESILDLSVQTNYRHLKGEDHIFSHDQLRLMKQMSPQWHELRKSAVTTGSTLFTALGLETLKKQQEHYDFVRFEKAKSEPTARIKERMEHGQRNEINAVATLVGKVFPCFYPSYTFSEEGCVKYTLDESYIIVSPDGSRLNSATRQTEIAVEIKCPFPEMQDPTSLLYTIKYQSITYLKFCRRWQHLEQLP